jgi:hypothetical protein
MRYVITWIILALSLTIGIGSINWVRLRRITSRGVRGEAIVIGLFPTNHNTLRYEYHVAGKTFIGQTQSSDPNPPLERLAVGEKVVIFYDPEDPHDSILGDPAPVLWNETISVLLAATVVPTFLVIVWRRKASAKQPSQAQTA